MARVGLVGCGLIGRKRADALADDDELIGVFDIDRHAAEELATSCSPDAEVVTSVSDLMALSPEIVIVATTHDQLTPIGLDVLSGGSHLLVEKPGGIRASEIEALQERAAESGLRVKVGFNHRFYPGIQRVFKEVSSGRYGEVMSVRGIYGHGGRIGYEGEWRNKREISGGGELVDQGMHLIDLSHWLAGPLPMHSALLRTQFWDTEVEDNATVLLGERGVRDGTWSNLSVSWTEWKNRFLLEVYCRTAKFEITGLTRSYGPQTLKIYRMDETMGPPSVETIEYAEDDVSWSNEWTEFREAIEQGREPVGNLGDALYAWEIVEAAFDAGGYARASRP